MQKENNILNGKTIILGVSAGIAAYKAADLASKLTSSGSRVFTVMTENAPKLVGEKTFEAITANPVFNNMWQQRTDYKIEHIGLAEQADIIVVAPATADIIAKTACGICDDMLSTILCVGWNKKILFAPAMNNNMWDNPVVQNNIKMLKERNINIIGPNSGRLACGTVSTGRMSEPVEILEQIIKMLA